MNLTNQERVKYHSGMVKLRFVWVLGLPLTAALFLLTGTSFSQAQKTTVVLDQPFGIERLPNGNTLIVDGGGRDWVSQGSEIIEVDPRGKVVWHFQEEIVFAHQAERLPNGNTLVVDTTNNRLLEVNPEKGVVWSSWDWPRRRLADDSWLSYPNDIEVLANGHFLVTDRNNNRVIEIDRSGKVYWQQVGLNRPHNSDWLPNGHLLISDSDNNRVMELDRSRQLVWSYGGDGKEPLYWPRDVDKLESGHYLITDSRHHRVVEVTPGGEEVWEFKEELSFPYEADRLSNGNTLISDSSHARVIEVDSEGKIVWEFRNAPKQEYPGEFYGNFERDKDGDGWPDQWLRGDLLSEGQGTFIWDGNVFKDGHYSARIDALGSGMIFWHHYYKVRPGRKYDLIGLIKSQDLKGYARFEIIFLDKLGGQIGVTARTPDHRGTLNWERYETIFTPPKGAVAADVWCLVEGEGTAWFDEIKLNPVGWQRILGLKLSLAIFGGGIVIALLLNKFIR